MRKSVPIGVVAASVVLAATTAFAGTQPASRSTPHATAAQTYSRLAGTYGLLRRPASHRDAIRRIGNRRGRAAASSADGTRLAVGGANEQVYLAVEPGRLCVVLVTSEFRAGACSPESDAAAGRGPVLFLPGATTKVIAVVPDGAEPLGASTDGATVAPRVTGNVADFVMRNAKSLSWTTPQGATFQADLDVPAAS